MSSADISQSAWTDTRSATFLAATVALATASELYNHLGNTYMEYFTLIAAFFFFYALVRETLPKLFGDDDE